MPILESDFAGGSPHTWYARMRDDDNNLVYEEKSLRFKYVKLYFLCEWRTLYIWKDVSTTTGCSGNIGLEHSFSYNQRNYQVAAGSSIDALPYWDQGLAGRVTYSYDDRYFIERKFRV